jgi:hypothetical protein
MKLWKEATMTIFKILFASAVVLYGTFSASSARASVAILDVQEYRCSNGENYEVIRHYWGGWGPGSWKAVAFCNVGILNKKNHDNYQPRMMDPKMAHPEVARCAEEDTEYVRYCFEEFKTHNGIQGGELEPLVHGRPYFKTDSAPAKEVKVAN